jgi:hypothetical protein
MRSEEDVEEMRRAMADATTSIPIADVRRLDVRPGDALVVRVPRNQLTAQSADEMRRSLRGLLGDGVRVVVTPDDVDITVVREVLGEAGT